jgi:hypothetical protein
MKLSSITLVLFVVLAVLAPVAEAQVEVVWDKSSITLTGECRPDGTAQFTVTNTGAPMAGTAAWREYEAGVLAQSGEFILTAGAAQVWTFASNGVAIRFEADQRPGHPGSSAPVLTLTCTQPTALTLTSFSATSGGNRGGCGMQGVDWCTVAASGGSRRAGYWVDLTCDYYSVPRITTRAKWRVDAKIELWGCIALDRAGNATRLTAPFTLARR